MICIQFTSLLLLLLLLLLLCCDIIAFYWKMIINFSVARSENGKYIFHLKLKWHCFVSTFHREDSDQHRTFAIVCFLAFVLLRCDPLQQTRRDELRVAETSVALSSNARWLNYIHRPLHQNNTYARWCMVRWLADDFDG